jgi:hypothetical protein
MNLDLFGTTDSGELIMFFWNGSSWSWNGPFAVPGDFGRPARVMSAVSIDNSLMQRASAILEDDNGFVTEFASDNGSSFGFNAITP